MGFTCGIIGLPNVGKSTLFNGLTGAGAETANYPFCTLTPNRGVALVPDARLDQLTATTHPEKVTPASLELLDVAGLVAGAHKGEGLGNQFLSHIRTVDAIIHTVRLFTDSTVSHIYESIDPVRDVEVVTTELLLADLEQVERRFAKTGKLAKLGDKKARGELPLLERLREALAQGAPARTALEPQERAALHELGMLTAKPVIYVANVDDEGLAEEGPEVTALRDRAAQEGACVVKICAALEAEVRQIEDLEERRAFYRELGLEETGLGQLVRAGYRLLDLITFYTTVGAELRAWALPRGTLAGQAAGRIHSDFERGFVRAEVIHWDDFDRLGGEHRVREAGLVHLEGRDSVVQDGDIVRFRFTP